MKKGGIYTAKGNYVPPSPNVTSDVKEWGKLVGELRDLKYTPERVRKIIELDRQAMAEKIANGTEAHEVEI